MIIKGIKSKSSTYQIDQIYAEHASCATMA